VHVVLPVVLSCLVLLIAALALFPWLIVFPVLGIVYLYCKGKSNARRRQNRVSLMINPEPLAKSKRRSSHMESVNTEFVSYSASSESYHGGHSPRNKIFPRSFQPVLDTAQDMLSLDTDSEDDETKKVGGSGSCIGKGDRQHGEPGGEGISTVIARRAGGQRTESALLGDEEGTFPVGAFQDDAVSDTGRFDFDELDIECGSQASSKYRKAPILDLDEADIENETSQKHNKTSVLQRLFSLQSFTTDAGVSVGPHVADENSDSVCSDHSSDVSPSFQRPVYRGMFSLVESDEDDVSSDSEGDNADNKQDSVRQVRSFRLKRLFSKGGGPKRDKKIPTSHPHRGSKRQAYIGRETMQKRVVRMLPSFSDESSSQCTGDSNVVTYDPDYDGTDRDKHAAIKKVSRMQQLPELEAKLDTHIGDAKESAHATEVAIAITKYDEEVALEIGMRDLKTGDNDDDDDTSHSDDFQSEVRPTQSSEISKV
jgi:hypothetical protein